MVLLQPISSYSTKFTFFISAQKLELVDIGRGTGKDENTTFEYINGWSDQTVWPGKAKAFIPHTYR